MRICSACRFEGAALPVDLGRSEGLGGCLYLSLYIKTLFPMYRQIKGGHFSHFALFPLFRSNPPWRVAFVMVVRRVCTRARVGARDESLKVKDFDW